MTGDMGLGEQDPREVLEWRSAPQGQGIGQHGDIVLGRGAGDGVLETERIDGRAIDLQNVTGHPCAQAPALRPQRPTQPRDVYLEGVRCRVGRFVPPEPVDEGVGAHDLSGMHGQHGDQRARLLGGDLDRVAAKMHANGAQDIDGQRGDRRARAPPLV